MKSGKMNDIIVAQGTTAVYANWGMASNIAFDDTSEHDFEQICLLPTRKSPI